MKICFKCNQPKPLSEFYRHSQMADMNLKLQIGVSRLLNLMAEDNGTVMHARKIKFMAREVTEAAEGQVIDRIMDTQPFSDPMAVRLKAQSL